MSTLKVPDATLDHWADVFVSRRIAELGVDLEQFLRNPPAFLTRMDRRERYRRMARGSTIDPCDADDPATQVRGGRLVEKLRHSPVCRQPTPFARRMFHRLLRALRE